MTDFLPYRKLKSALTLVIAILLFSITTSAQTIWTGNVSSDWGTNANWSTNSTPSNTQDVVIPATPAGGRFPVISATVNIGTLTIESGAEVSMTGGSLRVATFTNNGTFTSTGGSLLCYARYVSLTGNGVTLFPAIFIASSVDVTLNGNISCTRLEFESGNIFSNLTHANNASLTVNGDVLIRQNNTSGSEKTWDINSGSATVNGNLNIGSGGDGTQSGTRAAVVRLSTGTLGINGNLVFHANSSRPENAVLNLSGEARVNITGATSMVNNSGTIQPGASTFNFHGTAAQTINFGSSLRYNNIIINNPAGVTPSAAITATLVSGDIRVQSGVLNNGGFANAGASGKVFEVASGATFNITGTSGMVTGFTKTFHPASTVNYSGANQPVSAETYGHLVLSGSGTKTAAGVNGIGSTVAGNITLSSGITFDAGALTHSIRGNWTNNGATFTANTSTIVLNGTADQTLGGTVSTLTYNRLTVNKGGGAVILTTNATVNNVLTFTAGLVQTGTANLTIAESGSISGAGQSTGWVAGNLRRTYTLTTNAHTFDVGGANFYNPVTITFNTISTGGSIQVNASATSHANIGTADFDLVLPRVWTVTNTGSVVFTSYAISFNWNAAQNYAGFNAATLASGRFSSSWSRPTTSGTPTTTNYQASGLTGFGDFVIGKPCMRGLWEGTVSTDWGNASNWSCSTLPTNAIDVTIPSGLANYPVISSVQTGSMNNLVIQSGASITVNGGLLKIAGTITNNGVLDATRGTIEYNGSAAQTIPAGIFATNTVANLTINNTSGVSLQGALSLTDILSIRNGSFNTGGFLTLKSTETNTARVAAIASTSSTPIVGDVTVERYVPGRRKYRLVTSSVTTSNADALTAGQEALSIWGNWQNAGDNTVQNLGTSITGGASADGFDQITSSTSMFTYNSSTKKFVGFSSANGKNTKLTPLKAGVAYYMFVYGDRQNSAFASQPRPTVLKATGKLFTGSMLLNSTSAINPLSNVVGNFTLIGNPYACTIDWKNVQKSGVSNTIWGWDPNLNSTGGFVTITTTSTSTVVSPVSSQVKVSQYVQPGQGFFVQTTASNPQLQFTENSKISTRTNIDNMIFRTASQPQPLMAVNLLFSNAGTPVLADGAVAAFDAAYSKEVNEDDGPKMEGRSEMLALSEKETLLSINSRPLPQNNDTMFISLARLTKSQYTLEIFGQELSTAVTAIPLLQDTYLNTVTPLSLVDTNRIVFNVASTDPASSSPNRFRIIFSEGSTLPVTFASVAAIKKERHVVVEWKVGSEAGIKKYEVERSTNGISFSKAGEVAAKGRNNDLQVYQWLDVNPADGKIWYRIRSVEGEDKFVYSKSVTVMVNAGKAAVVVAPNPAKGGQINMQVKDKEAGLFTAVLYSMSGNEVLRQVIDHKGGTASYAIIPKAKLANGIYFIKFVAKDKEYRQEVVIQ